MRRHSPEEVASFFASIAEASTTWARLRTVQDSDGELVHMADGDGERFRQDTRAGLFRCVLPACDDLLTLVAGNKNRHHWRHRTTPSQIHSPETLWHITAKAALAAFAREQQPTATVHQDNRYTGSHNKPDVWVRWPESFGFAGDVAFEAQFSALDPEDLARRSNRYAADEIVPVWLFAHLQSPEIIRSELRPTASVEVRIRREHQAAARSGPLRWFNPERRLVATAYVQESERPDKRRGEFWRTNPSPITYTRHAASSDLDVTVGIDPLDECKLDTSGMHTPTDQWIEHQAALAADAERVAREEYERAMRRVREWTPSVTDTIVQRPRLEESPATRAYLNPLEHRCPCGGEMVLRNEWPSWYIPPKTTTALIECNTCHDLHGSMQSHIGPVDWPRGHVPH